MRLLFLHANSKGYSHILGRFVNNPSFTYSLKMYKSYVTGIINDSFNDGSKFRENMVVYVPLTHNPLLKVR